LESEQGHFIVGLTNTGKRMRLGTTIFSTEALMTTANQGCDIGRYFFYQTSDRMDFDENVLVIPEEILNDIVQFEGFVSDADHLIDRILSSNHLSFRPREQMELNPSFKQLIPYVILEYQNRGAEPQLFTYTRGSNQGESRLHKKRSIGIGGHICEQDTQGSNNPYLVGLRRELAEEIKIEDLYSLQSLGLLYDSSNEVGRVHLGIVHRISLSRPAVSSNERGINEAKFTPISALKSHHMSLETWSQICLDCLY
jgi:predicted NUDIX family phosphoesterase